MDEAGDVMTEIDRSDEVREWYAEDEIHGAQLLDEVHGTLIKYIAFANKHQPVAVTLWIVATHALVAWQHATRLIITSPRKRCGKSRLLDVVAGLAYSALLCVNATTAAIFRSIGNDEPRIPTLMFDEADALWGTKRAAENNEDLRALLNAGFQRDRPAWRCVGPLQLPTVFNTFAMAALAGIGRPPDTITDRGLSIDLKRRGPGENIAPFRMRRDGPTLDKLRKRINTWARDPERIKALTDAVPTMPAGIEDRAADAWEPMIAIADAAGGDWPKLARAACRALSDSADDADEDLGALLLHDIRQIFTDAHESFLASKVLVRELRDVEESPWGDDDLTASKLAKDLKAFGVTPGFNTAKTVRGYKLEAFRDAFRRYLRPDPSERPRQDSDQHEQPDGENIQTVRNPSEGVRSDGSGRLADVSDEPEKSAKVAVRSDFSDVRTTSDATPVGNGSGPGQSRQSPQSSQRLRVETTDATDVRQGHRSGCPANNEEELF
jgi:Protein of unknown function (DUF3631)